MKQRLIAGLLALMFAAPSFAYAAKPPKEELADQVRKAIEHGKSFLAGKQVVNEDKGDWEVDINAKARHGGWTSLALLALLNAGQDPNSPVIQRGLRFLRGVEPKDTYVVGLQTMVFVEAGFPQDLARIQRNVDWLVGARVFAGKELVGWTYGAKPLREGLADNSNTQYALLGLWAGRSAGAKINRDVWESIRDFYVRTQHDNGGWHYIPDYAPTLTMTVAGLCGLLITGQELNADQQKLQKNGVALNCGNYEENKALAKATAWVTNRFNLEVQGHVFYNLYGMERAGRLTGQRFFGEHDWYREGCDYLVRNQMDDGSWFLRSGIFDRAPIISTSFALLFLSKGRTPILISKLMHGSPDNPTLDWNRKHSDVRNLTDYASKQLFKRQPLGWQVFNARGAVASGTNDDKIRELVGDLLPSPIAYMSGHGGPFFTDWEKKMLRQYLEQGGFVLAEACCGSRQFDQGFRRLMKELFPDAELKKLEANHPIWRGPPVADPREFNLWGLELGCKTVVVYSPEPLSGWWEANQRENGRGKQVFDLGASIIAYATGLEMPKPRGFHVDVPKDREESRVPRGYLKVAQLKPADAHWRSAASGVRNLMLELRKNAKMDVALKTEELFMDDRDILNYKFMYMHGKEDFEVGSVELLKSNLETGGLLFADACCGKKPFDDAFRKLIKQMFKKDLEPIPANDELFGKALNGTEITAVRCRREKGAGNEAEAGFTSVAPQLEGIKIGNRWAVIYSKYDVGCALEKHQSSDCLGYDYESAVKLASAAVLYALQR
jgi:hypothetical protein